VLTAYSSFVNTIESLFSMALGDFDFHAIQIAQPILGPAFFFLFMAAFALALYCLHYHPVLRLPPLDSTADFSLQ